MALAQRKEDRKAHLQAQYMQRVSTGIRMQVTPALISTFTRVIFHLSAFFIISIYITDIIEHIIERPGDYGRRPTAHGSWILFYARHASPTESVYSPPRDYDKGGHAPVGY